MAISQRQIKKHKAFIIIAWCFFVIDRFLKVLALSGFKQTMAPRLINFHISLNNQLALSWGPSNSKILLVIIIIITVIVMVFFIHSLFRKNLALTVPLTFLLLGAISNIADRLKINYVIDYIETPITIFNLADLLIITGAIILISTLNLKNKT